MPESPKRVLTVTTNPAIDVSVTVDRLVPHRKLRARSARREAGGGGVNVARVLRRFGVEADAFVAVGGATGDELVELLERDGVPATIFPTTESTRESFALRDDSTGDQYRIVLEGPTIDDPSTLAHAIETAADGAHVAVLSGSPARGLPADFTRSSTERLNRACTIVDCSGPSLANVMRGSAFLAKPSRRELESVVGRDTTSSIDVEAAAREALELGLVENLVVSLGAMGALLVRRDHPSVWFAAPDVEVRSTVGAGDSMVAGIALGMVRGLGIVPAVRLGVAAGTATAATPGSSLCTPDAVDELIEQVAASGRPNW